MMQRTIKNKNLLRTLISEMLSLINEEEQPRESTSFVASRFEDLKGALQQGYDAGIGSADSLSVEDTDIGIFVKEAKVKKDELYVNLIKHALLVIECDYILTEIISTSSRAEDSLKQLEHPVAMAGKYGMSSELLKDIMFQIELFSRDIGNCVGFAYQLMSKGHLGGKEKVKVKLAQNATLGKSNAECLENLAEFIKDLEKVGVDKAYLKIIKDKKSKSWLKNKRPKYDRASRGNDFEFAEERAGQFSSNMQNCKSIIQKLFNASEGLEKLLDKIVKNSELLDDIEKVKN